MFKENKHCRWIIRNSSRYFDWQWLVTNQAMNSSDATTMQLVAFGMNGQFLCLKSLYCRFWKCANGHSQPSCYCSYRQFSSLDPRSVPSREVRAGLTPVFDMIHSHFQQGKGWGYKTAFAMLLSGSDTFLLQNQSGFWNSCNVSQAQRRHSGGKSGPDNTGLQQEGRPMVSLFFVCHNLF